MPRSKSMVRHRSWRSTTKNENTAIHSAMAAPNTTAAGSVRARSARLATARSGRTAVSRARHPTGPRSSEAGEPAPLTPPSRHVPSGPLGGPLEGRLRHAELVGGGCVHVPQELVPVQQSFVHGDLEPETVEEGRQAPRHGV